MCNMGNQNKIFSSDSYKGNSLCQALASLLTAGERMLNGSKCFHGAVCQAGSKCNCLLDPHTVCGAAHDPTSSMRQLNEVDQRAC